MSESVDLLSGTCGVVTFRNGQRFWCRVVLRDVDRIKVRLEPGLYFIYSRSGKNLTTGLILERDWTTTETPPSPHRDIVAFQPMTWDEARRLQPDLTCEICP